MLLKPIRIGCDVSIGTRSAIAAGAVVPGGIDIGPLSSSFELEDTHKDNRNYCRQGFPGPSLMWKWCIGKPVKLFVAAFTYLPVVRTFLLAYRSVVVKQSCLYAP